MAASIPTNGMLSSEPAGSLMCRINEARLSGCLELIQGSTRRKLHFRNGLLAYTESNVTGEDVVSAAVQEGLTTREAELQAVELMKKRKADDMLVLTSILRVPLEKANELLKKVVKRRAAAAAVMTEGEFKFRDPAAHEENIPKMGLTPSLVVCEAVKERAGLTSIIGFLSARKSLKLKRIEEFSKSILPLRAAFPTIEKILAAADDGLSAGEFISANRPSLAELLPALFAAILCNTVSLSAEHGNEVSAAVNPLEGENESSFNAEERRIRKWIVSEYERFRKFDHYGVLGVRKDAAIEQIKDSYYSLAKTYHADRYSSLSLGQANNLLQEIFRIISIAHETITNPEKRTEYDIYLDRKAKGLPTDVSAILEAEDFFRKAERTVSMGLFGEAERLLKRAIDLNATEADYHIYLGWAIYNNRERHGEQTLAKAVECIKKGLAMNEKNEAGRVFLGNIAFNEGRLDEAQKYYREVIDLNPANQDAIRGIRLIEKRLEKSKPGNLLRKIIGACRKKGS